MAVMLILVVYTDGIPSRARESLTGWNTSLRLLLNLLLKLYQPGLKLESLLEPF